MKNMPRFSLGLLLLALAAVQQCVLSVGGEDDLTDLTFEEFAVKFKKKYQNVTEKRYRQQVFEANKVEIQRLNNFSNGDLNSPLFSINQFADLTPAEFKSFYFIENSRLKTHLKGIHYPVANADGRDMRSVDDLKSLPDEKNWYLKATTAVRNQGQCGSCWAYSCVEQVESDWFLSGKSGKQVTELSTQQVIDCDVSGAYGCGGTYAGGTSGYDFIEKNGGLASYAAYPDTSSKTGSAGKCKHAPVSGGTIKNSSYAVKPCLLPWDDCKHQDEDGVLQYVGTKGPLSICVNARQWVYYKSGIMSGSHCGSSDHGSLDHCVQLVGYNRSDKSAPYWIVRNSWDTTWGQDGFIYLAMGNNTCGVADVPSFAIV